MVPRHREDRNPEPLKQRRRQLVLVCPPAVRQVSRDDDGSRTLLRHDFAERRPERPVIAGADMQIGDVNEPDRHDRSTLYTQIE